MGNRLAWAFALVFALASSACTDFEGVQEKYRDEVLSQLGSLRAICKQLATSDVPAHLNSAHPPLSVLRSLSYRPRHNTLMFDAYWCHDFGKTKDPRFQIDYELGGPRAVETTLGVGFADPLTSLMQTYSGQGDGSHVDKDDVTAFKHRIRKLLAAEYLLIADVDTIKPPKVYPNKRKVAYGRIDGRLFLFRLSDRKPLRAMALRVSNSEPNQSYGDTWAQKWARGLTWNLSVQTNETILELAGARYCP